MAYCGLVVQTSEIEKRVAHYRGVVQQWSDNLLELDEHPTYRLLAAGEMAGTTGEQTNPVMENTPLLWGWLGDLRRQLETVDGLIAERSVFNNPNSDVGILLGDASIPLRVSELPKRMPANARAQLEPKPADPDTMLVSCDGLIELFRVVYEPVRDAVAQVDAVWRDLMPRIDAATVTLGRAEAMSSRLSVRLPEVMMAKQRLEAVRSTVSDDPLSLSSRVGPDLDTLVSAAAEAAGSLESAHGNLDSDLQGTDAVLAELRVLRARAAAAYSEAEAKVIPETALIKVPGTSVIDGPNGLAHRAAQIVGGAVGQASEGTRDWHAARRELDQWQEMAGRLKTQLSRALEVNAEPIGQRNELRGRLRAYRVKASMMPGLPQEIDSLGQQAHDELYTRPSDMKKALKLIDEFARRLANYGGSS